MMNNLFSIFDPSSCFSLSLNWLSILMIFLMVPSSYWIMKSPLFSTKNFLTTSMKMEFSTLLKKEKNNIIIFFSLFIMIMINNLSGLMSFTFTATSHLSITLALAFPLWVSFIIYSTFNKMKEFLAHLVPLGTPGVLMPFMVIIEIVSNIIRPITLSVRLAANMIAGHLLIALLSNKIVTSYFLLTPIIVMSQSLLMILETAVACIQAYVFSILITLYASEA